MSEKEDENNGQEKEQKVSGAPWTAPQKEAEKNDIASVEEEGDSPEVEAAEPSEEEGIEEAKEGMDEEEDIEEEEEEEEEEGDDEEEEDNDDDMPTKPIIIRKEDKDFAEMKERTFGGQRARLEYLRGDMNRLNQELFDYRRGNFRYDEDFEKLKTDIDYEFYLRSGGFPQREDGFRVRRIYPSLEEIFHERPPIDQEKRSINWKIIENKVYVKEFFEEAEVVNSSPEVEKESEQEELVEQEGGSAEPSKLTEGIKIVGEKIKKVEIPEEIKRDFENLIGGSLTLRLGVLSIVISIIIAYNYLMSTGYIPAWATAVVGLCMGTGFFGLSYFLYLKRLSIVSIMVGIGMLCMYYTVYIALNNYHIVSPVQAFSASLFITLVCISLSLFYDKRELAVVAIFGAYLSPYLANRTSDVYSSFLLYLLIINVGMLVISYLKNWRAIHFIAFVSTVVFMVYWISNTPNTAYGDLIGLFIFASIFYIIFYVMTVVFDLKEEVEFTTFDFYMSLVNTVLYLYWGVRMFTLIPEAGVELIGVFLLVLAILKGGYIWLLYDKPQIDQRLLDIQIGSVILLVNISIYLIFEQNIYLNTLYALESAALLWLGLRMNHEIIKAGSVVMMLFAVSTMVYAWWLTYQVYPPETIKPFLNKGFWAGVVNFTVILFTVKYLYEDYTEPKLSFVPRLLYASILGSLLLIIGYLVFEFELMFQTRYTIGGYNFRLLLFFGYTLTYLLFVRFVTEKANIGRYRPLLNGLVALVVTVYAPLGYFATIDLRDGYFQGHYPLYPFLVHYFNVGMSVYLMYQVIRSIIKTDGYKSVYFSYAVQLGIVLFVAYSTVEYEHLFVLAQSAFSNKGLEQLVSQYRATSFTILWVLLSFGLMYFGMRIKLKDVRMMALLLFGLTIAKFFIVDFWRMEVVGKIVSFMVIGAILIVISQLYQKQLRLLVEEGELVLDKDATISLEQAAALAKVQEQKEGQPDKIDPEELKAQLERAGNEEEYEEDEEDEEEDELEEEEPTTAETQSEEEPTAEAESNGEGEEAQQAPSVEEKGQGEMPAVAPAESLPTEREEKKPEPEQDAKAEESAEQEEPPKENPIKAKKSEWGPPKRKEEPKKDEDSDKEAS